MSPIAPRPGDPDAPSRRIRLPFDPSRDGFSFVNTFTWTEDDLDDLSAWLRPLAGVALGAAGAALAGATRSRRGAALVGSAGALVGAAGASDPVVRRLAQRWPTFGLCGGMALAAVERWAPEAGGVMSQRTPTSSLDKEAMRPLFRRRQAETLRRSLPRFAALWTRVRLSRSLHPRLAGQLARDVQSAVRQLEAGRPALLGLIGDAPDPFTNHQVVAFGADLDTSGMVTFHVYDPNAPGETRHIRARPLASDPRRTDVWTDIPTGPRASGCHISTRPNWLATLIHVM